MTDPAKKEKIGFKTKESIVIERLETEKTNLKDKVVQLRVRIGELESENKELKREIANLKSEQSQARPVTVNQTARRAFS